MHPVFAPDNIALITGAASGIGRATAARLAGMGMRVVLVDINATALHTAKTGILGATSGDTKDRLMAEVADVADSGALDTLAQKVSRNWGTPSFLMNNAAAYVHGGSAGILDPLDNWRHTFDVNMFGILNGVAAFLPAMLASRRPAMIVNTGSKQGLTHPPGNLAYNTVKAAVNAYTMNLARDLRGRDGGTVSAHLLVPGWTTTGDFEHRQGAWRPEQIVGYMLDHLARGDFYIICPDDETSTETDNKRILWQALEIIKNRPALSRWHPDFADAFAKHMKKELL